MTHPNSALSLMLGRTLLGALFLVSGLAKIGRFAGVAGFMASKGLPAAEMLLVATIALEVAGGLALIAGWRVRYAAWALLVFTGLAAVIFHAFWAAEAPAYQNQLNHFLKNAAIMGGLLCLGAVGAGSWSVDERASAKE
ncbi:DoxX family protein [Variovorax sp. WS11]|uniref:DoxX family protein n=1 Tax=Variovorax sp. WS11 TaxID=1105204 RepID=UPI000D0CCA9C|nr:DoxX family protein [Variovorax sp. WS11]NDZ17588.1 DoxX family protein [Variovorax sp. WS11]PSL82207.1 DoxX family protein [Variovorax sp. WS11]